MILQIPTKINNHQFSFSQSTMIEKTDSITSKSPIPETIINTIYSASQAVSFYYDAKTGISATSPEQLANLKRLFDIVNLEEDWNGYGARPIDQKVITTCATIVRYIAIQPTVLPTPRNSIDLSYRLEDKSYLEFEVFVDKIICVKVPQDHYTKAVFERFYKIDMERINQIVREFYEDSN